MMQSTVGAAFAAALDSARLSQRTASRLTGISQTTLSRIIAGQRTAKMPEIIQLAEITGHTVAELTGTGAAARVQCAARSTNGSTMERMHRQLVRFVELNAFLDDQAISAHR